MWVIDNLICLSLWESNLFWANTLYNKFPLESYYNQPGPQLQEKIVFDDLLGYVKPLEQQKQKYFIRIQRRKKRS